MAHARPRAANAARIYQIKPGVVKRRKPTELADLFDLEPYDRNQVSKAQINQLRDWVDVAGLPAVSAKLDVSSEAVLRVCAGFGHRLQARTAAKMRRYFEEGR